MLRIRKTTVIFASKIINFGVCTWRAAYRPETHKLAVNYPAAWAASLRWQRVTRAERLAWKRRLASLERDYRHLRFRKFCVDFTLLILKFPEYVRSIRF